MRASNRIISIDDIKEVCQLNGTAFEASAEFTIPAGGNYDTLIYTGDKPFILYSRQVSYSTEGLNAFIYRDPLTENITGGTPLTSGSFQNANDFIPEDSVVTITPNVTVPGGSEGELTRRIEYVFGNLSIQGRGESLELIGNPQMVKPGEYLLLRFASRDVNNPQTVASHVAWLEPENIPGLEFINGDWVYRGVAL